MSQKPLRTYERNPKPAFAAVSKTFFPRTLKSPTSSDESDYSFHCNKKVETDYNNIMDDTFDRIFKTAKLPPLPVQPPDDTSIYTSSSENSDSESLESIPIKNPSLTNESKRNQNKKRSQKNIKKQPKTVKKAKQKETIQKIQSNYNVTDNESIEFPSLKKTQYVENKQTTSGNLIDKLTNKSNIAKSAVMKELKECCVTLTRLNLSDKNFSNLQLSSGLKIDDRHYDSNKNSEMDKFKEKVVNPKECKVIVTRLNIDSEQNQKRKKIIHKLKPEQNSLKSLLNVDVNAINSSTPFDKRYMPKRSRLTLSPIKNDGNILIANNDLKTVLFDETEKLYSSHENDKRKSSINKKVKTLSKIKDNNNDETSIHEKTTQLIFDESDEIILNTFANNNSEKSSELAKSSVLEQPKKSKISINHTEEEKENTDYSNSSSILLFSEIDNVGVDKTDEKLIKSQNSLDENSLMNSEGSSMLNSEEHSIINCDESSTIDSEENSTKNSNKISTMNSDKNSTMNSEKNSNSNSTAFESNENIKSKRNLRIQHQTILIDSQNDMTEGKSKADMSESDDPSINLSNSENDEDSLRLVLSSTSSDKDSIENNSKKVLNEQDSLESSNKTENSNINNDNLSMEQKNIRNLVQPMVVLTRLKSPYRVSEKRDAYKNWKRPLKVILEDFNKSQDSYQERLNNNSTNNKTIEETSLEEMPSNDLDTVENLVLKEKKDDSINNESLKSDDKVLFLKPGKSWARSLSILNNIHNEKDIESLSLGKGKKWRQSVRNVLSMQPQGVILSCINNDDYEKNFRKVSQLVKPTIPSSTSHGLSPGRFIRRMSVRVVPNVQSNKIEDKIIQDTSFLEVYGINNYPQDKHLSPKKSLSKVSRKTRGYNLRCSNVLETIVSDPVISAKSVVLQRCNQKDSLPFNKCYPDSYLKHCRKIGEGVYGEVFLYHNQKKKSVIKIIPIEGNELVNGEPQKKFDEIFSEIIIAKELHNLRFNETFKTSGFVEVKNIKCMIGKYPQKLLDLWEIYDNEKNSENDSPSMFGENQLYIALELGDGGQDMEAFQFHNATEAYITFLQIALTLAVGEKSLEFEHRDMHWGNVLISRTKDKQVSYKLENEEITLKCNGLKVTIIDFTLSRMSYEGCCIFNDLALDPALFNATGEYQFEIYRLMKAKCRNNWQLFEPYTNILWLHYVLDKMIKEVRYNEKTTKVHKTTIQRLQELKDIILSYHSAFDFISNCDKLLYLNKSSCN